MAWVRDAGEAVKQDARGENIERGAGIIGRLHAALEKKIREVEDRIAKVSQEGPDSVSVADSERDARTLTALARLYGNLVELDDAASKKAKSGAKSGKDIDAHRFRDEIAARLERMLEAEKD